MLRKIGEPKPPRGAARWLWRAPILLYRLHLGFVLGDRFLLLTHVGRKSGEPHRAVLEVVAAEPERQAWYVASGFGEASQWFRNLVARPACRIQLRNGPPLDARAEVLQAADAEGILRAYAERSPKALRTVARLSGYAIDGTPEDVREFAGIVRIVRLRGVDGSEGPAEGA